MDRPEMAIHRCSSRVGSAYKDPYHSHTIVQKTDLLCISISFPCDLWSHEKQKEEDTNRIKLKQFLEAHNDVGSSNKTW